MKNKCKILVVLTLVIVFLFYRVDSVVAIANEQFDTSDVNSESTVESETEQNTEPDTEPVPDYVSTGPALMEWLEAHKNTGGSVMLTDNIVLDGYYAYCPCGINMPPVFVDTDKYTITITGETELMSDDHLTFSGQPDGKSVFYVAEKGVLSMTGVAVESGQCALWQEEGAGLVTEDCHISGNIHYADTPFVIDQDVVYVVVEKEQTVNDVLPTKISCTVNCQGQIRRHESLPISWNLEASEKQQEERQRFQMQGSFLEAASVEPAQCTVAYNDFPLTFLEVTAADDDTRYTFRGGYTKPEEALPITVISEYSFDGENWIVYDEEYVTHTEAGFFIGFRSEECDRAVHPNIYIRLQWNDNGTPYFSNVLCYAADNLENVEDIGGSRGGGTSIINLTEDPEEKSDSNSDNAQSETSSDTNQAESGEGDSVSETASDEQSLNTEAPNVNAEQSQNAESLNSNADSLQYPESKATNTDQSSHSETKTDTDVRHADTTENNENSDSSDSDSSQKEEAVAAISVKNGDGAELPQIKEQTLRSDIRESNAIIIATGFVLLSVLAGIMGFYIHSRSGTNR